MQTGKVELRSALGQRFISYLNEEPQEKEKYESMKGTAGSTAMKQAFRTRWAELKFETCTEVIKSQVEMLREEYGEEGRYMSLERLIVQEGGPASEKAIAAALSYAASCVTRGYPWVLWHDMKNVTEILVFERVRKHSYKKSWSIAHCQKMLLDAHGQWVKPDEARAENTEPAQAPPKTQS